MRGEGRTNNTEFREQWRWRTRQPNAVRAHAEVRAKALAFVCYLRRRSLRGQRQQPPGRRARRCWRRRRQTRLLREIGDLLRVVLLLLLLLRLESEQQSLLLLEVL